MNHFPILAARSILLRAAAGILLAGTTRAQPVAPEAPAPPSLAPAHALYFSGQHRKALSMYQDALTSSPTYTAAWANGGLVWGELGEIDKSANWLRRAAQLAPADADIAIALAEAEFKRGRFVRARDEARRAAGIAESPYARLAQGRAEFGLGRWSAAAAALQRAAQLNGELTVAHYWLGRALESDKNVGGAIEAYKKAAFGDSYFTQARYRLVLALMAAKRPWEAWPQVEKLLTFDPENREFKRLESAIRLSKRQNLPHRPPPEAALAQPKAPAAAEEDADEESPNEALVPAPLPPAQGVLPMLRIGIGTNRLGKPIARKIFQFSCTESFSVLDAASGKRLARGEAGAVWKAVLIQDKKKRRAVRIQDAAGHPVAEAKSVRVEPDHSPLSQISTRPLPSDPESRRLLRGAVEFSPHPKKAGLHQVNVIDVESYTHGVLGAEMPVEFPIEALKAQAVVARTQALYIQSMARRHARDNYDVCDGQHCQVYSGVNIETQKSRGVVDSTRGRVVTYLGRVAHVLYAANCGGHTQDGSELSGWGNVPYWKGILDAPMKTPVPDSPWTLRQWLRTRPAAYCAASTHIHPSHFRWTRVVAVSDVENLLQKTLRVGPLRAIVGLKRSRSGHLNSVLIRGTRRSETITSELRIRSLLGVGSQRSALFALDIDLDPVSKRPKILTFYGGGWGHGVGMCQSGASGRAEAGKSYVDILRAYYPGTELGDLRY